jgi:hypothetical protein
MLYGELCKKKFSFGKKFNTADQLKSATVKEWRKVSQRFIDKSMNEWRQTANVW